MSNSVCSAGEREHLLTTAFSEDATSFHNLIYSRFITSTDMSSTLFGAAVESFFRCMLGYWLPDERIRVFAAYLDGNFAVSHDFSHRNVHWRSLLEIADIARDNWIRLRDNIHFWDRGDGIGQRLLDCGKDFGSSFTLYMTITDVLHRQYGDNGYYVARLLAVLLFGFDSHTVDKSRLDDYRMRQLEAQKHFVSVLTATNENPFSEIRIAEIAGNGGVHQDYSPVMKLFASYQNVGVGVQDGKQVKKPVPAYPSDSNFITRENYRNLFDLPVDYVWSSNVFSYGAMHGNRRRIDRHMAELLRVCTDILAPHGRMFHLNAYDSIIQPKPALNDLSLIAKSGLENMDATKILAYSGGKVWAYCRCQGWSI